MPSSPTPWLRNLVLSPALLAGLALGAASSSPFPTPNPNPTPTPTPTGPNKETAYNSGVIVTNPQTCNPAPNVGDLGQNGIAAQVVRLRSQKFGLPLISTQSPPAKAINAVAHDHLLDMMQKNYLGIVDAGPPARTLLQQVVDAKVIPSPDTSFEAKAIIFQGCVGNNTVEEVFDMLNKQPLAGNLLRRGDWTYIGTDAHHPSDGLVGTIQANPSPNYPKTNTWMFVFVKIYQNN